MSRGLHRPKAKVYAPERRWARDLPERHRESLTRRQVTNLVRKIWEDNPTGFSRPPSIRWTGRRGGASANQFWNELMFTHNSVTQETPRWLVCHEMAHMIAPRGSKHDATWLGIYVDLVTEHIGAKAGKQLWLLLKEGCQAV